MTRPTYITAMGILAFVGFLLAVTAYQLWWPIKPITVNEVKIISKEVRAGGELKYYVDATKHMNLPAMVVRQLINDTVITLAPSWSHVPMGRTMMMVSLTVPINVHPGRYKLSTSYTYEINSFRTITNRWETEYFTVLPPEKGKQ